MTKLASWWWLLWRTKVKHLAPFFKGRSTPITGSLRSHMITPQGKLWIDSQRSDMAEICDEDKKGKTKHSKEKALLTLGHSMELCIFPTGSRTEARPLWKFPWREIQMQDDPKNWMPVAGQPIGAFGGVLRKKLWLCLFNFSCAHPRGYLGLWSGALWV